jgi:hypothetical protein
MICCLDTNDQTLVFIISSLFVTIFVFIIHLMFKTMTKYFRNISIVAILILVGSLVNAQEQEPEKKEPEKKEISENQPADTPDRTSAEEKGVDNANDRGAVRNENAKEVKEVRGARPEIERSRRGARPEITRPAGTGRPAGAGRPEGAGRPGKR